MRYEIWEDSSLALTAALKTGLIERLRTRTATWTWRLLVNEGGTWEQAMPTATTEVVRSAEGHLVAKVPKVTDTDDYFAFAFDVEANGTKNTGKETFRVWPKTYELKAVTRDGAGGGDDAAEKPAKEFCFDVEAKPVKEGAAATSVEKLTTDDAGQYTHRATVKGRHTFTAHSPWEVVEWRKKTGRKRECVVTKKPFQVTFVWPEPGKHNQYVNLADQHGTDEGSTIELRIAAKGDAAKGKKGVPIYVQVKFLEKNSAGEEQSKRNSPARSLVQPAGTEDKGVWKGTTELERDGGEAKLRIQLGQAGGDECEVKIGVTETCQDATLNITNWRKLWYQLTVPPSGTLDVSTAETALEGAYVEYEKYKDETIPADSGPAGSWFPGSWVGRTGTLLNIGDHNKTHFHALFADDKTPVGVHLLCCHTQYDAGGATCVKNFSALPVTAASKVTFGGAEGVGITVPVTGGGVFPKSLKDDTDSFTNGQWTEVGGAGSGAIPLDHTSVTPGEFQGTVSIKLPAAALALVNATPPKTVHVSFDFFVAKGPYNGESAKWLQLLALNRPDPKVCQTMVHELGHTMNQVVKTRPPGMDTTQHGREYTANGHQGGHCADGMSEANYAGGAGAGSYQGNFKNKSECTCVMYGEGSSTRLGNYCKRCAPFVKGEALTSLH